MASPSVAPILVTGASGYIATHVVYQLLEAGHRVRGTVMSLKNQEKCKPLRLIFPTAKHPIELVEADLMNPDCWKSAVEGCEYVIHIASPCPAEPPKNEDDLIKPAVQGTLSIMRAARASKTVKRVVLTSSVAAVCGGITGQSQTYSEADWTDIQAGTQPYAKSKTLAEKAAWEYIAELPEDEKFELSVIIPAFTMGPILCGTLRSSMMLPKRLLMKEMPLLPKINFATVDVRDVAKAHVVAMTLPEAAGQRHILSSHYLWMQDVALILEKEFKSQGYDIPTKVAPNMVIKLYGIFDATTRLLKPALGQLTKYDNTRMVKILGITPRSAEETYIEMGYSMIEKGFVKKTNKYTGPPKQSEKL